MHWLKTWLRKWLGVDEVRAENAELIQRMAGLEFRFDQVRLLREYIERLDEHIESVRQNHVSVKEMGDACMARLDRETMKLATAIGNDRDGVRDLFHGLRKDLTEVIRYGDRDDKRISELEVLLKDATLDTALAALEERVGKLEAAPAPATPQGRRGGSSWGVHQAAAAAGAAREKGADVPIPTPGIS